MKIRELFESVSTNIFHFTEFRSVIDIIKSDTLRTRAERISFSRSIIGDYPTSNRLIGVYFVVDGQLLNANYKGKPYGGEEYDIYTGEIQSIGKTGQLEDAIDAKQIKNFSRYVKAAIIFIDNKFLEVSKTDEFEMPYSDTLKSVPDALKRLASLRVPLYFINRTQDLPKWRTMRPQSAKEIYDKISEKTLKFEMSFETAGRYVRKRVSVKVKGDTDQLLKKLEQLSTEGIIRTFRLPSDANKIDIDLESIDGKYPSKPFSASF